MPLLLAALLGLMAWTYALVGTWFCDATCPGSLGPFQALAVGGMIVSLAATGSCVKALLDRVRFYDRAAIYLVITAWASFAAYLLAFKSARP